MLVSLTALGLYKALFELNSSERERGLPRWLSGKESACQCRRCKRYVFDPWVRKIPWRRKWHPTPVFLPGKSHGRRSLAGNSPWAHKESHSTSMDKSVFMGALGSRLEAVKLKCSWRLRAILRRQVHHQMANLWTVVLPTDKQFHTHNNSATAPLGLGLLPAPDEEAWRSHAHLCTE